MRFGEIGNGIRNKKLSSNTCISLFGPRLFTLLVCAVALGACGPIVHEYNWAPYPIADKRVITGNTLARGGSVSIVNENTNSERQLIGELYANEFYASSNHLGDAVVSQLTDELRKRRFTVSGSARNSLRINVTNSSISAPWFMIAHITLDVTAGNGYHLSQRINNATPGTIDRAFNGVVALAVIAILNDPKIVDYLTGPS